MSIQDKIKPCHRCGETAHYDEDWAMILCGVCGYYLQQDSMDLEQLIKFWNTRKIEEDLERQLEEAKQNIYKFAEIALMEGEDEFGYSWEDFKLYVLDEQLKEKGE